MIFKRKKFFFCGWIFFFFDLRFFGFFGRFLRFWPNYLYLCAPPNQSDSPPLGGPRWGVIDQFCSWWSIWYLAPPKNGWNGQIPFNVIVSASLNIFLAIWWVFNSNYAWATLCKSHNLENSSCLVIFFSKSGVRQKGLVTFSFWSFENLKLSKVKKKIFSRKKIFFFVFFLFFRT